MSNKQQIAVLKVVAGRVSVSEAARRHGISRQHLHRLIARYREGGLNALEPVSRRPKSNPNSTSEQVRDRIIQLRISLTADGFDAGPVTIAWHLDKEGLRPPSTSTIRRILHSTNLITPEPKKRPKSSYIRFEAAQPNQTWQSDFTHWKLADDTDCEILNWLDDHSRYLLGCTATSRTTGPDVINQFLQLISEYGPPASTLTDNGVVYTARYVGGKNAFELALPLLGIKQKNGSPGHPQTQGKIERFHQTLKRYLTAQPPARNLTELQTQLDTFRHHYNEHRPHRARNRTTPGESYRATPKALPAGQIESNHYRLRYDHVGKDGKVSFRLAGRMHHLGIGIEHKNKRILAIADPTTITTVHIDTGEIIALNQIDPTRTYWRNTTKTPGRWPKTST